MTYAVYESQRVAGEWEVRVWPSDALVSTHPTFRAAYLECIRLQGEAA